MVKGLIHEWICKASNNLRIFPFTSFNININDRNDLKTITGSPQILLKWALHVLFMKINNKKNLGFIYLNYFFNIYFETKTIHITKYVWIDIIYFIFIF